MKKILFIQYTDPAAYPPILRAARILVEDGWKVAFWGVALPWFDEPIEDDALPTPSLFSRIPKNRGLLKLHYLLFVGISVLKIALSPGASVYVSDAFAAPVGILAKRIFRRVVVYHEHDPPVAQMRTSFWERARLKIARIADVLVVPQKRRLEILLGQVTRSDPSICALNCPLRSEVSGKSPSMGAKLDLVYMGSINGLRLPASLIKGAILSGVVGTLKVYGYETTASKGHVASLKKLIPEGCGFSIDFPGTIKEKAKAFEGAHLALCVVPTVSSNEVMDNLVGASNKPFDALANGVPLIVSNLPAWRQEYVDAGVAFDCDPSSVESVASTLIEAHKVRHTIPEMAKRGSELILGRWNYEEQFAPVKRELNHRNV